MRWRESLSSGASPTKVDFNSVGVISRSGGYGELHRRQNHLTTKDTKEHEGMQAQEILRVPLCPSWLKPFTSSALSETSRVPSRSLRVLRSFPTRRMHR